MKTIKYLFQVKDAGDYREFIARRYGAVMTHGGNVTDYRLALNHINKLARWTGLSFREVLGNIQSDYAAIEEVA